MFSIHLGRQLNYFSQRTEHGHCRHRFISRAALSGYKEAVMFLSIPACWKESRFLLLKTKSPTSLLILLLGTRCVHILKENWLVEESLSSGKISDVWQTTWKPVPKISPELLLTPSVCVCVCVCVCVRAHARTCAFNHSVMSDSLQLEPWTVALQTPLTLKFSRQEYWSGLWFLSPGDLPDPEIEPRSPALQADSLLSEPQRKPQLCVYWVLNKQYIYILNEPN